MKTPIDSNRIEATDEKGNLSAPMPDEERRRILKKLAACAFVAPAAMVLLEGGDNLTYAGQSGGVNNPLEKGFSYKPTDEKN